MTVTRKVEMKQRARGNESRRVRGGGSFAWNQHLVKESEPDVDEVGKPRPFYGDRDGRATHSPVWRRMHAHNG